MVLRLISSTPSPYARKIRIQLMEKNIPYELSQEVPWNSTTETPKHNPLEKLPVLIFDDGRAPIYESSYITTYVEEKFEPKHSLTPSDVDDKLFAQQIDVLATSVCDAFILWIWEQRRGERASNEWSERQNRKVEGGVRAIAEFAKKRKGDFLVGDQLSIADLSVCSMLGFLKYAKNAEAEKYPELKAYADKLDETRKSFAETKPAPFDITDKVV